MSDEASNAPLYFSGVCFVVAIASFWLNRHLARRRLAAAQELVAEATQVQADFSTRARTFVSENLQEWPHRLASSDIATRSYLLINQARTELRFLELVNTDRMVLVDQAMPFAAVLSVELQQNSETVMRVETSSAVSKRGSAGRAAMGALVAGPVGAIVGAASRSTTASANSVSTTYTQAGPIFLVIGTSDFDRPVIKMEASSLQQGEEWLHRIRAGMVLSREAEG